MKRKCLFLDRDGVINYDYGHVYKKSDFKFIPGIFRLVQLANRLNFLVIIITNQAGIAKGYYSLDQFEELTKWMLEEFKRNCLIEKFIIVHHKDGIVKEYKKDSLDRKPNPGMLLKAAKDYAIDLEESIIIGDKITDIIAGEKVNLKYKLLFNNEVNSDNNCFHINKLYQADDFLYSIA